VDADLDQLSDLALLDLLWEHPEFGDAQREAIYTALRERLDVDLWPELTFAAAKEAFGPAIYNTASRSYKALDKRIRHARRTWRDKFGPLNAEQEQYADIILAHAIHFAAKDAATVGNPRMLWPYVQNSITQLINHENVHAGFKRRADKLVDVTDVLKELAA
jgi:hypothetical protein